MVHREPQEFYSKIRGFPPSLLSPSYSCPNFFLPVFLILSAVQFQHSGGEKKSPCLFRTFRTNLNFHCILWNWDVKERGILLLEYSSFSVVELTWGKYCFNAWPASSRNVLRLRKTGNPRGIMALLLKIFRFFSEPLNGNGVECFTCI